MPNFVIDKITKKVLRYGFVDFSTEAVFNPVTEEMIYQCCVLLLRFHEQDWYWNESTQTFQETQPE